jgi:drug/metabolite transporter (DMT)-like permease
MPRRNLQAHLSLTAVVLIWGVTFPLVKSALHDISPLLFNLIRMAVAFAIMAAVNHRLFRANSKLKTLDSKLVHNPNDLRATPAARRTLSRQSLRYGAIAGFFLGIGYQFQTAGLARTTASKSAFITGLVVVFVPILSLIPLARTAGTPRTGLSTWLGALTAFAGLILLTTPPGSGTAVLSGLGTGEWLTLIAALCFAAHLLTLSHAGAHVGARTLGTLQVGFSALVMLLTLPLDPRPHAHFTRAVLIALAVTAILATAVAFTIQSWAQQHLPASHTALICTLEPVFAWLTSLLFLHERLGPRPLAGAGLILLGILAAELVPGSPANLPPESQPPTPQAYPTQW